MQKEEIQTTIESILDGIFLEKGGPWKELAFSEAFNADIFDIIEIVVALEDRFGIEIPDDDISRICSFNDAVEYIAGRIEETREWIAGTD